MTRERIRGADRQPAVPPRTGAAGDAGARSGTGTVEEFCRALRPRLLGTLSLQCGHHVAEELTQETLSRVYDRWAAVRLMDRPEAWAYRVAFNLARSALRRRLAERRALARVGVRAAASTGLDQADVLALRAALRRLPARQRTALVLRFYADLPLQEVAEIMGCAPGTVSAHVRDALAALRSGGVHRDDPGRP